MNSRQLTMKLPVRLATRLVAIVCFAAFLWVVFTAQSLPDAFNQADVGPARVPMLAALLGMVCSVLLFIQVGRLSSPIEIGRPLSVLAGAITILAYAIAMPLVGFYLASCVSAALLVMAGGERRVWAIVAFATGFCLFIYLSFDLILNVQFP